MDRIAALDRVRERSQPWDVIVIGGGATGVGCALDAAARGYDVLLLEQHDLGKGTSSRSTKLIHGGVRYLRQGNISIVRESLKERGILLRNAPHVVNTQEFVIPCYSTWQKLYYGAGLKVYELLSGKYSLGPSRLLSREQTLEKLPSINEWGIVGGVSYQDGRFDDARLLIDLAATADELGATILNYSKVTSLTKRADERITGVTFENTETGELFDAPGKVVINATGAFCDSVRAMSDTGAKPVVTYSQGVHLVLDGRFIGGGDAIMIPETSDGRVLFCIPWHGYTLIGTTDTPVAAPVLEPTALESEIDFILETAGKHLADIPSRNDILSVFAGIRPLIKPGTAKQTSSISRGHDLFVDDGGLVTITGGKWTTYRRMAEDAVDKAAVIAGLNPMKSATADLPIKHPGGPSGGIRIRDDLPYTDTDVSHAVQNEMARTVEDVLARRTRALFLNAGAAMEMAPAVARIMAAELGLDQEWIDAQIASFTELASKYQPSHYSVETASSP